MATPPVQQPQVPFTVSAPATAVSTPTHQMQVPSPLTETTNAGQAGRSLRKRAATGASFAEPPSPGDDDDDEDGGVSPDRTTRSGTAFANRPRWMPKLKLKVTEGSDGRRQSFLGPYDRDLDSEDDELAFEEHFLLRLPPGKDCDRLKEIVAKKGAASDIWFKFKDNRRAVFHIGDTLHPAKLVDLPCILESSKTLDNKHMFKVADIGQMLVVEDTILPNEEALLSMKKSYNPNDHLWPHGITPPLRHVRKRRFRKRLNRQAIEVVELEVSRLLAEEKHCTRVDERVIDDAVEDLSDSEYIAQVFPPEVTMESDGGEGKEENDDDLFAAAIEQALQDASDEDEEDSEDSDEDGDEGDEGGSVSGSGSGSGSGSDEDEDDEEYSGAMKLVGDEIKQLQAAIMKKNEDIAKVTNNALKNRFINAVAKMSADLEGKLVLREQMLAEHRAQREREAQEEGEEIEEEEDGGGGDEFFNETMDMS
ncbi:hypothetical protein FRC19_004936 [Serendipita sp. 401]|nr:hypothetical protein FRC19_004936 [Serendipita sp. 401]KAG8839151.1 hypothetical protein FRC18_000538 [Serendipita sp. 400]